MSANQLEANPDRSPAIAAGWRELWLKEDWWAIWLGLGIVIVGYALFANGASLKWIAVTPEKWSSLDQLGSHFAANAPRYLAQFVAWLAIFTAALTALGFAARDFVPSFVFLYVVSVLIFVLGQWTQANYYNLEPPLVALLLGLLISNLIGLPRWMDAGFRVEFYVKTGIVLLGATLPFSLSPGRARSRFSRRRSSRSRPFSSSSSPRADWGSTGNCRRRSARAARCAAFPLRSPSPAPLAPRRNTRRSPSRW